MWSYYIENKWNIKKWKYMGTQKIMSLSIEFESWVSPQNSSKMSYSANNSNPKLIKNELFDSNSDSKLIENV